jgi:hypothetical protein
MRRWGSLFVLTIAVLGGSAEAGPESSAANSVIIQNIESFIAAQRQADGRVCAAQGYAAESALHRDCIRDLAARRRAEIEGAAPPVPAGLDI